MKSTEVNPSLLGILKNLPKKTTTPPTPPTDGDE